MSQHRNADYATYYHGGPGGCGAPAFRYRRDEARAGAVIQVEAARLLDGTVPLCGEAVRCGTCQQQVGPLRMDYLG